MKAGVVAGLGVAALTATPLAGFAVLVAFALVGMCWREEELPVRAFCLLYQWLFVVTGYFYLELYGQYPARIPLGDMREAVFLSLLGLLCIALGMRLTLSAAQERGTRGPSLSSPSGGSYEPRRLFWIVIALFSINWVFETFPMAILFNAAQLIHSLLVFRYLFFLILLMVVVQQKGGYQYAGVAFVFVLLPELTSSMAKFKDLLFMLLVVLVAFWKPWSAEHDDKARNAKLMLGSVAVALVILATALVWTGGMKYDWRTALRTGEVTGSPIEKIEAFGKRLDRAVKRFDGSVAVDRLTTRLSSSAAYFSRVVERVPEHKPHEKGKLTWRALRHVLMPRILFPEKPNLGGDSWLVREYAGLHVAGDESQTSVGLGYMAEFYVDFGPVFMLVPLVLLGALLGIVQRMIEKVAPSRYLSEAAVAGLLIQHFTAYEAHFTKLLGGFLQTGIVFIVVIAISGPWLHRILRRQERPREMTGAPSPGRARLGA